MSVLKPKLGAFRRSGCVILGCLSSVLKISRGFDLISDFVLFAAAMFYGTNVWDPWLIVGQIICLQCSYYLTLGLFLMVFLGLRVPRLSLVYLFDYATLTTSTVTGWCVIATFLFSSLAVAWYMVFMVERARKCLDFSATLYIIHLFLCIMYGGWPSSMAWWVVNGTGLAVMALLAEYLCIKREQREIPMDRFQSRV